MTAELFQNLAAQSEYIAKHFSAAKPVAPIESGNLIIYTDPKNIINLLKFLRDDENLSFKIPIVYTSTIGVCAFPGACHNMGPDSMTIVGIWADASQGSTVSSNLSWTRFNIAFATGGVNGQPTSFRLPLLALATATANGASSYSGYITTAVPVNAFESFGMQCSTVPSSGLPTQGAQIHFDYTMKQRFP